MNLEHPLRPHHLGANAFALSRPSVRPRALPRAGALLLGVGCALLGAWCAPGVAAAQEVDAPDLGRIAQFIRWGGVLVSLLVVAGAAVVIHLVDRVGERLSARFADRRPTILLLQSGGRFAIYLVTIIITISLSVQLDERALTVIGGALAFAVGFAMRDLVAALIAGITIMFDRPFQVGDRVEYAGQYGDIIKIGLRSVRMYTLDHYIVTIPNNKVLTDVTAAATYGELEMQVSMNFYIGTDQNAQLAVELIREACLTSPYVFLERPVEVFVKEILITDYVAVHIKARPYVFDCKNDQLFTTDVHLRVLAAFQQHGIHPPALLHRDIGGRDRARGERAPVRGAAALAAGRDEHTTARASDEHTTAPASDERATAPASDEAVVTRTPSRAP